MNKPLAVVSCPIDTYSGYGARSRDFVKALIKVKPEWDVKIISQRWGNTKFGYLGDHNEDDLISRIIPNVASKPNVWIQITVPNEFQPVGEFNIGVTAGIETTVCHQTWVQGVNRMNLILTSANHAKQVFENSTYEQRENNRKIGELKLNKPVEVLFEGIDTSKYYKTSTDSSLPIIKSLDSIKESFCFLIVGHWLSGDFGHDRKNIGVTIERFLTTFRTKFNKPALVIKTQSANAGLLDQKQILKKIDDIKRNIGGSNFPNIYLIHGELNDNDINQLYNHPKIKSMVSFTKGEGFGRPLLEFTTTGKPIICSAWSGQTDFLRPDLNLLVGGKLNDVHPSSVMKDMIIEQSKWFDVNLKDAATALNYVFKNYKKQSALAKRQAGVTKKFYTMEKMAELLKEYLDKYIGTIAVKQELKLPAPDEIKLPQRPKK